MLFMENLFLKEHTQDLDERKFITVIIGRKREAD